MHIGELGCDGNHEDALLLADLDLPFLSGAIGFDVFRLSHPTQPPPDRARASRS